MFSRVGKEQDKGACSGMQLTVFLHKLSKFSSVSLLWLVKNLKDLAYLGHRTAMTLDIGIHGNRLMCCCSRVCEVHCFYWCIVICSTLNCFV